MMFEAVYHRTLREVVPVAIEAEDYDRAWGQAISMSTEGTRATSTEELGVRLFSLTEQGASPR